MAVISLEVITMEYLWLFVLGSSIWVGFDSHALGMKRDKEKGVYGPWFWFIGSLLLWIVIFPAYLAKRVQFKRLNKI